MPDDWAKQADVKDDNRPGVSASESAELRELRHRNWFLEPGSEVFRRAAAYLSQANIGPKRCTRSSASWPSTGAPSGKRVGYRPVPELKVADLESAPAAALSQDDSVEMKRVMRHVVYVAERDGDFTVWVTGWKSQGYDLMPLNIDEPDSKDGRIGRAFELQGPLTAS